MDSKPNRDATINVRRKTESSSFRLHKDNTRNIKEEINRIPKEYLLMAFTVLLSLVVMLLFMKVIASNMKTSISDIAVTLFGIIYITFFLAFISMLYGMEKGKYLIWFILISAWGTDTFAYLVGMKFGKHKFSKISPKKSKEGCVRRNNRSNINIFNIYILHK